MKEDFYKNKYGIQWKYAEDRIKKSLDLIQFCNPKTVLDCGCGDGFVSENIKKLLPKTKVFGVDISTKAGEKVRAKNIIFKKANLSEKIPFPDRHFDLVFAGEIIEHLENPDQFLKEVNRVLKNKGYLVISTPNLATWYNRVLLLFGVQPIFTETSTKINPGKPKIFGKESEPVGHLRVYTIGALKGLLDFYGLKTVKTKGAGFLPKSFFYLIDKVIAKFPPLASEIVILSQKNRQPRYLQKIKPLFIVRHLNLKEPSAIPYIALQVAKDSIYQPFILTDGRKDKIIKNKKIKVVQKKSNNSMEFFKFCAQYIKDNNINVVSFWGSLSGGVLISSLLPTKTKVILNIYSGKPKFQDFLNLKPSDLFFNYHRTLGLSLKEIITPKFMIRYILNKPNVFKIITPSQRLKTQFEKYTDPNKIIWLKHGIDFKNISIEKSKNDPKINKNKPTVMYLGHCYLTRGIDDLIKGSHLAKKDINFQLALIFSKLHKDNSKRIYKIIKKYKNLEDTIILNQNLGNIYYYLDMADIVVLPYRFSPGIPEYPLTLLEAMALKKIIITTPIGAITELITDQKNGICVKPKNPREISSAIKNVLSEHIKAKNFGQSCYNKVKEISWQKTAKKIDEIIKETL